MKLERAGEEHAYFMKLTRGSQNRFSNTSKNKYVLRTFMKFH